MGRKSASRKVDGPARTKASSAPGSRVRKIESYEDTLEEGGVDDFMFKRDRIMLNPRDESDEEDVNANEGQEVLGLNIPKSRKDEYEEDGDEEEDVYSDEELVPKVRKRKLKGKEDLSGKGRFGKAVVSSDEEEEEGLNSEDEEGWGRQYYSKPSNRREKEQEDHYDEKREEEREMEVREVKRLQKKAREAFGGAEDWGMDESDMAILPVEEELEEEAPAPLPVPETTDSITLIRYLESNDPVKLALARDFPLVVYKLQKTAKGIGKMMEEDEGEESLHKGLGWLHYQTLLTYATTLAYYIHLCALPRIERPDFTQHPIHTRLLQLKEGVSMLEELDFAAGSVSDIDPIAASRAAALEADDDEDDDDKAEMIQAKRELIMRMLAASGNGVGIMPGDEDDDDLDVGGLWQKEGLDDGELDDLLADAEANGEAPKRKRIAPRGRKSKKGIKNNKLQVMESATQLCFTHLAEPTFVSTKKKSTPWERVKDMDVDILGDPTALNDADAADKERRKKSLRFHTSKIASTSARRAAARAQRLGGDEDVPYRDRHAAALRRSGKAAEGEALDDSDFTDGDKKRAREVREENGDAEGGDDVEGYYDLVKRRRTDAKAAKAAAHEEFQAAKFADFADDSHEGGPRALTRAIEKNRGLTPRRSKTGRNPRVKKRQAYEKAKQKVASQRAVFTGGQASLGGSYSGEKTGISTAIKSRKF